MTGTTIGHYSVIEKLGEGGMGVVYKARDTRLERSVALKLLAAGRVSDPARRRRFVQEARSASALNHPNIVHIYDVSESEGLSYIAMELISGKTLGALIGRKGLDLQTALKYAIQVADALAKAHAAGIVHRDLKPSNVMVTAEGLVKVLDFGLAKLIEGQPSGESSETETFVATDSNLTAEGVIVGTVAYMSPEQAEGKPLDARSDIFSFGSLLYEMITGQRAFRGDSRLSTMAAILREETVPVSRIVADIPVEVDRIIQRCLRKDPARRFQHMDDLKVVLEEVRDEFFSGTTTIAGRFVRKSQRKRRLVATVAAASILLAVAVAVSVIALRAPESLPPLVSLPLTSYAGTEENPTFSPDGTQVAFAWTGEKDDNYDIYVKLIGPGDPLRLTKSSDVDRAPAWSPDGRWIAFLRLGSSDPMLAAGSIMLIPALGGPERRLTSVRLASFQFPAISWSSDGEWVAFSDQAPPGHDAIWVYNLESGRRLQLTAPPSGYRDRTPAFSPDSSKLAFSRSVLDTVSDLYVLDVTADMQPVGSPKRLTSHAGWVPSPAWTPDGRSIIYSTGQWGNLSLRKIEVSGSHPEQRLSIGEDGWQPALSRDGKRLIYARSNHDLNIWRLSLAGQQPGTEAAPSERVIASTRMDHTPSYSPDGQKIAFSSNRSGSWEIWTSNADGSNPVQLTSLNGPFTRFPTWSPDGRRIAFDSRQRGDADIFVIASDGGRPEPLTSGPSSDTAPTWSRDGRWIYFNSDRSGQPEIWRMSVADPRQLTRMSQNSARGPAVESPDGAFLYYASGSAIQRLGPLNGEHPLVASIPGIRTPGSLSQFGVTMDGILFFSYEDGRNPTMRYLRFKTGQVTNLARIPRPVHIGFAVSPDGNSVLYTQLDQDEGDLLLVENFR